MSKLTLELANQLIGAALEVARAHKFKPMGIVVLDEAGHLKAAQRQDGASMFRLDVATGKAWGAVGMGVASRALSERAKENPNFMLALSATAKGRFLPQPGAVVIKDADGTVLGAAGASGGTGDEDELICKEGIAAVGLHSG